jgi:hypothetical protein
MGETPSLVAVSVQALHYRRKVKERNAKHTETPYYCREERNIQKPHTTVE